MNTKIRSLFLGSVLSLLGATLAPAFVTIQPTAVWLPGTIPFEIKLGTTATPAYVDGTNPSSSLQASMAAWNAVLGTVQFAPTIVDPSVTSARNNNHNEILFSDKVYGDAFGSGVLAVTLSSTFPSVHERVESDIIFNTFYTWDSYRGTQRTNPDIRRVSMHELGHVLGLDHPDDAAQVVSAVMNSHISSVDALASDDITGGQSLYGAPGAATPAVNDNFVNAVAITLTANAADVTGTSVYGTKEPGEPLHADLAGGKSSWWKWTAPANGSMQITTNGSRFDTTMGVYTGASVSGLATIAKNDDQVPGQLSYSTLNFTAVGGTTYWIAIDGYDSTECGYIQLTLTFTPASNITAPAITAHPAGVSSAPGASAQFSAAANGAPAPTYQWQRLAAGAGGYINLNDSGTYSGTATGTLTVTGVTIGMNGDQFRLVATNVAGSATSNPATLTVAATVDIGRLFNLSVRTNVSTGAEALFVGFVIGGSGTSGPKPTLIRGVGPTLTTYGVGGVLADPTIDLINQNSGVTILSNNDWAGNAQVKATANSVGAFPLQSDASKDSALYTSQGNAVYSVKVTGVGSTTGIALAEIYDATPNGTFTATTPRLVNVSARTVVGTGEGILIAGFVIGGSSPCRVLIRGVGPKLAFYGVGGALANPKLELYQRVNGTDTLVASNDDWGSAANAATVITTSTQVGAFALDAGSKDAVILVTLQPGVYSAQVSGVGGTTGVALAEIYEAP
ncbi:MAG: hypothetical protein JWM32_325 [Verrucomicrobia bacterium]|nr:hypothetical protein [Verrucomicrobiota bacterium]